MRVGAVVYLALMILVVWAGRRGIGSRWTYAAVSGMAAIVGTLAIILSPSAHGDGHGLAPTRPWSEALLAGGSWIGGGLLVLSVAALIASMLYRMPSAEPGEHQQRHN
jgi:hypothetical protein